VLATFQFGGAADGWKIRPTTVFDHRAGRPAALLRDEWSMLRETLGVSSQEIPFAELSMANSH
jgi:hypothetical protein